jgi:hypothetical protein
LTIRKYVYAAGLLALCFAPARGEIAPYCGATLEETIKHSSAAVYGADVPIPFVRNTFPITADAMTGVRSGSSQSLELVAVNKAGQFFTQACGALCSSRDAMRLIAQCRDTAGCQIVGGVQQATFYPFYNGDRDGGHICLQKKDRPAP